MQDGTIGTVSKFDLDAWREELLALNSWACGLTIDEGNAEFAAARQKATLARHAEGKGVWNAWANGMLALKSALADTGQWASKGERPWTPLVGENQATQRWLTLASTVFGIQSAPRCLETDTSFDEFIFPSDARFEGATFNRGARFENAIFSGLAEFTNAIFNREAWFEGATFHGVAAFGKATFADNAWFEYTTFHGAPQFQEATFNRQALFGKATFATTAWFERTTFNGEAWFALAIFNGEAEFRQATFNDETRFERATFNGEASFGKAAFGSVARFVDATFNREASFIGAKFDGAALFWNATFGRTFFLSVRFNASSGFDQAKFKEPATFSDSFFQSGANFEGINSSAAFSLKDATFKQVPSFIGATFNGTLRLDNVETPRYRWTLGYAPDRDATARFRELRRQAKEAQDVDRELEFFAQEVRTGRFHVKGLPSWVPKVWSWRFWFGLAFGAFSDFGRSLWRPLLTWLVMTSVLAVFYLGERQDMQKARAALDPTGTWSTVGAYVTTTRDAWRSPPACRGDGRAQLASTDALTEAFVLSLRNGMVFSRFDSANRTYACLFGDVSTGEAMISPRVWLAGNLQSLASAVLIFLFLLAVRNLLRLK
jgi:pentapeptide repeat protein